MCLGELARVLATNEGTDQVLLEVTAMDGARCWTALSLVDDVATGDIVLVHSGFALRRLDPDEARDADRLRAAPAAVPERSMPRRRPPDPDHPPSRPRP